jgi:hypothetical protein
MSFEAVCGTWDLCSGLRGFTRIAHPATHSSAEARGRFCVAAAANVGPAEQAPTGLEVSVVAYGADHRPHRADDHARLPVDPLEEMIAAPRDDVHVVAGQRGELVVHRRPLAVQGPGKARRHAPPLVVVPAGRDDRQRSVTQAQDAASERLAGAEVDAVAHGAGH